MQTPAMPQMDYRPITKFWRVGKGIAEKLAMYGIDTSSMIEQAQEAAESETVKRIKPIWAGGDSLLAMYQSRFPT